MDIDALLVQENQALSRLAEGLEEVWRLHLITAISIAKARDAAGQPLRNHYRAIEPRESLGLIPTAVTGLEGNTLSLNTGYENIAIQFGTAEQAALAAVAAWTAIPRQLSVGDLLGLHFQEHDCARPTAVKNVLVERHWSGLIGEQHGQEIEAAGVDAAVDE